MNASTIPQQAVVALIGAGAAAAAAAAGLISSEQQGPGTLLKEDVQAPSQALQMDCLVKEIQAIEDPNVWSQEFLHAGDLAQDASSGWSEEFVAMGPHMNDAWASATLQSGQEFIVASEWAQEMQKAAATTTLPTSTMTAAEFIDNLEKLGSGNLAEVWVNEYDFEFKAQELSADWSKELISQSNKSEFWEKLQNEWDQLAEEQSHSWLSGNSHSAVNQEYKFAEDNPLTQLSDPVTEGKRLLAQGDIPSAVLAFESAVQKNPEDAESWGLLGTTQAQNENDPLAISALNKSLQLQPQNLGALMALAASLTNEAFQLQAGQALVKWLSGNPKYSRLAQPEVKNRISSVLPRQELADIQASFIEAARLNPHEAVDPDVQSGLGILFNLGNDYEKAADCFKAALNLRPTDSLLWNRLGATLANGGKSAEAISAYRRALELSPGFIRTRYNLGVSCINLNAYKEAAEHFLTALSQQANGKKGSLMSDSIWNSLRMVLHLMNMGDLSSAVDERNLEQLNKAFRIIP